MLDFRKHYRLLGMISLFLLIAGALAPGYRVICFTVGLLLFLSPIYYYGFANNKRMKEIGDRGEAQCVEMLKQAGVPEENILRNLFVPTGKGKTAEIDVIALYDNSVYVCECKNYRGRIIGDWTERTWKCIKGNGKVFSFYSPIFQNDGHIRALRQILPLVCIKSLIVFGDNAMVEEHESIDGGIIVTKASSLRMKLPWNAATDTDNMRMVRDRLTTYTGASDKIQKQHLNYVKRIKHR